MVVFVSATMGIPPEMANDITVYDFKLPTKRDHSQTLARLCEDTSIDMPSDSEAIVDACAGLTQEGAENALAKSLVDNGRFVYTDVLEKKAQSIKETGYLKFGTFQESFEDLYGLEYMKWWALKALKSKRDRPKGILIYGVPGAGKSHYAKGLSNELGVACLEMSFSGLRGGLVGDTERNTADCWKKIESFENAVVFADEFDKSLEGIEGSQSDGGNSARIFQSWMQYQEDRTSDTFWVATCNKLDTIMSWSGGALAARFDCIFFVDMPTPEECKGIARIWSEKKSVEIPEDYDFEGFSGRDIKKLARQMAMLDCSVDEARRYIIPVAESDPNLIQDIRKKARKTCIWASKEQETLSVKRRVKI
jgi:SpoVK/Ycf46/Vps4 family AAA+-type ATPase